MKEPNPYQPVNIAHLQQADFSDPETELNYLRAYIKGHDDLLNNEGLRTVKQEGELAYARAYLMQRGIDESRLPWEISVSYDLRLAEYIDKLDGPAKKNKHPIKAPTRR